MYGDLNLYVTNLHLLLQHDIRQQTVKNIKCINVVFLRIFDAIPSYCWRWELSVSELLDLRPTIDSWIFWQYFLTTLKFKNVAKIMSSPMNSLDIKDEKVPYGVARLLDMILKRSFL